LAAELEGRRRQSLDRQLRPLPSVGKWIDVGGRRLLNLAGNDYLGLARHPRLVAAAQRALETHGTGSGASRLVAGSLDLHAKVEADFARFKHAEAALLFPTGYMANLGVLQALAQSSDDLIVQNKLNHASLIDAARRTSARVRTYPHRNLQKLERLLADHHQAADPAARRLVVSDSVFSMDGDTADLPQLCDICERHDAVLVVDEAHATGLLGSSGSGLVEASGMVGRVPVTISTASKALGGLGGVVSGSRPLIDTLINLARTLIYTTASPPAQVAAIGAAVEVVRTEPQRRQRLATLGHRLAEALTQRGWPHLVRSIATPIVPLHVGTAEAALSLERRLNDRGLLAVAIRPPTVPPGTARVRLSLRADLSDAELQQIIEAVGSPS
jgi:8-amino-7-oxononanoate synthase